MKQLMVEDMIKALKCIASQDVDGDLSWMKDIAELLEKQIPKIINMYDEIKYLDGQSVGWVCPTCNVIIFDFGIYDYCPHCGQKLEWRNDNIEAESN